MASMLARFESSGFLLVGIPANLVCAAPVDSEEALHHRTVDACQTICNYPYILEWMQQYMMGCVEACIKYHGGHFEHI
jgi:hypothetical protein